MALLRSKFDVFKYLMCACGKRFTDDAAWHAHLGECPFDRCALCLAVLGDLPYDDPESHVCPTIQLYRAETHLRGVESLLAAGIECFHSSDWRSVSAITCSSGSTRNARIRNARGAKF